MIDKGRHRHGRRPRPVEYAAGHVPNARAAARSTASRPAGQLPSGKPIIFVCATGQRSALAAELAAAFGGDADLYNLEGGNVAWQEAGLPVDL